jgi:RHS repeat-associated protein
MADFFGWHSDGNIKIRYATSVKPDLITTITNGLGAQTALQYKPLSDPGTHARATSVAYPYRPINDSTYVVRAVSKSDGQGGWNTTGYTYGGYLMHVTARQPVGFTWIQRVEPDGSWTNDYYNQNLEASGTLLKSETFVPGNRLVKRVSNTWILGDSSFNRIMLRLRQTKDENFGPIFGELISSSTTDTTYDGYGYPTTTVVTRNDGRKTTTTDAYQHDTTYWLLGLKTREQVTAEAPGSFPQTRITDYAWDPRTGLKQSETIEPLQPALMRKTEYGYDPFGNQALVRVSGPDIATRETVRAFDSTGRFNTGTRNALGHTEYKTWDTVTGKVLQHTGPNGLVTAWSYDGFGRPLTESRPDGTSTTTGYFACDASCPANAVMRVSTAVTGGETKWVYSDVLGREIQSARTSFNGNWVYKTTIYDTFGRVAQVSHPYRYGLDIAHYTTTTYDALHRPLTVTAPGNRATTTSYYGNSTTVTDPGSRVTTTYKDSEGHVTQVTDALGGTTLRTYDPFGNLRQILDPANNVTTLTWDIRGRQIAMSHPDLGAWTYAYNVLGEMTRQQDAKGQVTTFAYDLLGRMTSRARPDGTTTWTYDTRPYGKGKIASAVSPGARTDSYYDSLGRSSQTTTTVGTSGYTMTTGYDAFSRPSTLTYPTGFRTRNIYDDYGHLKEVWSDSLSPNVQYWRADAVDGHGRTVAESLGSGVATTHAYDAINDDLQSIQTTTAANALIQSQTYTFTKVRNLKTRTWYDGTTNRTETFTYDGLNRVTAVTGPAAKTYAYDAAGNLTSKSDVGTYTYPAPGSGRPHAVTATAGVVNATYTYDGNGNMTGGNGRTLTWTSFNKVKTATVSGLATTLAYGPGDERVSKQRGFATTHYVGGSYEVTLGALGQSRHFVHANGHVIGIYTSGSGGTGFQYYHTDHLGSVEAVTTATGALAQRVSYDAWGKTRNANGTDGTVAAPRRGYTGLEHDDDAALINMDARQQEPLLGRFISPDPLGNNGDPNPYAYANNNPLKYVDPSGTQYNLFESGSSFLSSAWMGSTSAYGGQCLSCLPDPWDFSGWSRYNSGSSLGEGLWGSTAPTTTSYSLSSGFSGSGNYRDPYSSIGAGWATGVPSYSSSSYSYSSYSSSSYSSSITTIDPFSLIPVFGAARDAYNDFSQGNWGSGLVNTAFAMADIASFGAFGLGMDVGRVARAVASETRALSTIRYTQPGETFYRYESGNAAFSRITSTGGVTPGTYAAPISDGLVPLSERASVYSLPNPEIPRSEVFTLRPPADTLIIGPKPVRGGTGNEVIFPFGF